ncbi:MAG TPA: RNA polymerase subunit sigma-24 [Chthoniobacteraceae bacterium]|jgi:RNA polymerase sigma-70 factor (ECF subfamily)|nr:RNA polymerase subunit sigma-24 [Chthoniobacteraceae bacterium]
MDSQTAQSNFPETRWTLVRSVRESVDPAAARQALAQLCADYWYPLFAFARRYGHGPHDAQDLTQGFFAYLLEKNLFAVADPQVGKLRTFLLTAFQRHLRDVHDRNHAQRRGGGCEMISLDLERAENRYLHEPVETLTPAKIFERTWALAVIESSLEKLRSEETAAGRHEQFGELEPFLSLENGPEDSYAQTALRLKLTQEATRQAVSRLRRKFRTVLSRKIEATLINPTEDDVAEELLALRNALRI